MNKIRSFFNQNRKKILIAIIFIVFFIIIIQVLDKRAERKINERNIYSNSKSESKSNKSVISDSEISESAYKFQKSIVSDFVEYCNKGEIEKAYELISTDCKEELYPTVGDFKKYYYDNIFTCKRTFSMQNWNGLIYIVRYTEDVLSTGRINDESTIQDYVTIVFENEKAKLNINSYLGRTEINKENSQQDVKIKVLEKRSYMNYEIYDFEVENNTGYTIILDTLSNNTMYLTDQNRVNHYSINNEISKESLVIKNKYKSKISIKFDNPYIVDRKIKTVTFNNIGVCYENNSIGAYKEIIKFNVNI